MSQSNVPFSQTVGDPPVDQRRLESAERMLTGLDVDSDVDSIMKNILRLSVEPFNYVQ